MLVLHTSDLHLGQTLAQQSRHEEQRRIFLEITQIVRQRQVDAILICGDLYDTVSPSIAARRLFFDFLHHLTGTSCHTMVVTGGNHDSPTLIELGRDVLRTLPAPQIHLIGSLEGKTAHELVIPLRNASGDIAAICLAVPYLRLKDALPNGVAAGISPEERLTAYREGVRRRYAELTGIAVKMRSAISDRKSSPETPDIPILAMGHLFVTGAIHEGDTPDPVGMTEAVPVDVFGTELDYVALGHLHRRQTLTDTMGAPDRIGYCGSPMPLDFSESTHRKGVVLYETTTRTTEFVEIRPPRPLRSLRGTLPGIRSQLETLASTVISSRDTSRNADVRQEHRNRNDNPGDPDTSPANRGKNDRKENPGEISSPESGTPLAMWLEIRLPPEEMAEDPAEKIREFLTSLDVAESIRPLIVKRENSTSPTGFPGIGTYEPAARLRDFPPRTVFETLLEERCPESPETHELRTQFLADFDEAMRDMQNDPEESESPQIP
ncbi:MAG: exonuclease subunit SbcD [Planctomycetia bacterium]|nr:exonuclease subunit SbcD [Planctomycetia bacterium]